MLTLKRLLRSETTLSIILVVLTTLITYGVLIPALGFYRDDWYFIWTAQAQGTGGIIDLFKIDRPFMGVLYALEYPILGAAPFAWHVYALLLKLLGALGFFWLLRTLWPEKRLETTFMTLLFVVYPGFLQEPNAATFQNHLFGYGAAILSIALTVSALKSKQPLHAWILHGLAMLLALVYFLIYEYMIGLEVARFLLVAYAAWQENNSPVRSLQEALRRFVPYALVMAVFLFWRIFVFQSTRRATSVGVLLGDYSATPLHAIATLLIETAKSTLDTAVLAWGVPFYQFTAGAIYDDLAASMLVALLVIGLAAAYYRRARQLAAPRLPGGEADPVPVWIWMGALITVFALIPLVAAGRSVQFSQQWDRYTLQASLGAVLFAGGCVSYLNSRRLQLALTLLLVGLGVSTQYQGAVFYRDFWELERQAWWQLTWRAPALKANTVLIVTTPPGFRFAEEYEIFAPVNIIYYPGQELQVDAQVLNKATAAMILRGDTDDRVMRSIPIHRDYAKDLIASFPFQQDSCLHVVDGDNVMLPYNDDLLTRLVAYKSDIGRLLPGESPRTPPVSIFGKEPPHTWCYYYEKMELAGQVRDWREAARLADEALRQNFQPQEASEWMVIFRAYVNAGENEKANALIKNIKSDRGFVVTYCLGTIDHQDPANQQLCGSG